MYYYYLGALCYMDVEQGLIIVLNIIVLPVCV